MKKIIVITYPNPEDGEKALNSLKEMAHEGRAHIDDSAVIVKDAEGKVTVHGQASSQAKGGAVIGGFLGLLVMGIFPVAGIALGAAGGALVGHSLGDNVDKKFVQDVRDSLQPNSSALLVLGTGEPAAVAGALRQYKGTLYHTNIDSEAEATLRRAIE